MWVDTTDQFFEVMRLLHKKILNSNMLGFSQNILYVPTVQSKLSELLLIMLFHHFRESVEINYCHQTCLLESLISSYRTAVFYRILRL
jgi:hypothetical protein